MMSKKPKEQLDFFSSTKLHWNRQSKDRQQHILEQLAFLLLSCIKEKNQPDQMNMEDQSCQQK